MTLLWVQWCSYLYEICVLIGGQKLLMLRPTCFWWNSSMVWLLISRLLAGHQQTCYWLRRINGPFTGKFLLCADIILTQAWCLNAGSHDVGVEERNEKWSAFDVKIDIWHTASWHNLQPVIGSDNQYNYLSNHITNNSMHSQGAIS